MENNIGNKVISLKNVSIKRDGSILLNNITVSINRGDFVYLVGKTGSGKSTFLESLYANIKVHGDEAIVTGFDLIKIQDKKIPFLRRRLGIAFQDFQLLMDRTIEKNLEFAMKATGWRDKEKIRKRKEEVLNLVGLENKQKKMPATLSDGEKQRIVIARAILNNPELIIADEPTGSLDPETSAEIMRLLFDINKNNGTTVLMATHDYMLFRDFPAKILKCEDGRIEYANF